MLERRVPRAKLDQPEVKEFKVLRAVRGPQAHKAQPVRTVKTGPLAQRERKAHREFKAQPERIRQSQGRREPPAQPEQLGRKGQPEKIRQLLDLKEFKEPRVARDRRAYKA